MEHRLAAILAADVVGYSLAMEANEEDTLARLKALRTRLFNPAVEEFHGRIFKTTGDGALVEFSTSVEALRCALRIQRPQGQRKETYSSNQNLLLRIGINVGDVIVDEGDVYGNSVNVAARLEGLAPPGGICLSGEIYQQVHEIVEVTFDDLGEQMLKNVTKPVRVYRVASDFHGSLKFGSGITKQSPEKPTIAVLPLVNLSGDPKQSFLADGIADDLITAFSKLKQLRVIARNSTFSDKVRKKTAKQLGEELSADYLVEGSVRKAGDRIRINAQLVDCEEEAQIWAERYDRDLSDIFDVQDDITRDIVSTLAITLRSGDLLRLRPKETKDPEAYELFLKGREALYKHSEDQNARAIRLLEASSSLDPHYAPPVAFLCNAHLIEYINEWGDDPTRALERSHGVGIKAVNLDPDFPWGRVALGNSFLWMRKLDKAIAEYKMGIKLDPNFADAYMTLGWAIHFAGQPDKAIDLIERGMLLDPNYAPMRLHWLAQCLFQLGRYEEAIEKLKMRLRRQPHSDVSHALLAACFGYINDAEKAKSEWEKLLRVNPSFSVERRRKILPYKNARDFDRFVEGLSRAGIHLKNKS